MTPAAPPSPASSPVPAGKRLTRADWIDAAIRVMTDSSVEAVRIERLAVDLGASKGSFYWHFKDRPALLAAVLDTWRERQTLAVQARLATEEPDPCRRILRVMELPLRPAAERGAAALELAVMGWARRSDEARAALHAVDAARTDYLVALFAQLGADADEAAWRAHQAYALLRYVAQRGDLAIGQRAAMVTRLHARLTEDLADQAGSG